MVRVISWAISFLRNFFSRPVSGPNARVIADLRDRFQSVAISVNEKSKVQGSPPRAKARNFLPRRHQGRLELSTFCLEELELEQQWQLLDEHSPKQVLGKAELSKPDILGERLALDANWEPERHVDVIDWPEPEEDQKQIAQSLLAKQRFTLR